MSPRLPSSLACPEQPEQANQAGVARERPVYPVGIRVDWIRGIVLAGLLAALLFLGQRAMAQERARPTPAEPRWLTGRSLAQSIQNPVSIAWTDAPIGPRLRALADSKRVAILFDRRIDPEQRINLSVVNVTLEQFFFRVADALDLGVCRVGNCWYFGPLETARSLPTAWQTLPAPSGTVRQPLRWPNLSTPASISQTIAERGKIRLRNLAAIPYDLWHAGSLPELTPAEQLAAVAIGFDQWPRLTRVPGQYEFVPFTPLAAGRIRYPRAAGASTKPSALRRQLSKEFRDCQFRVTRSEVEAKGPTKQLYEVTRFLVEKVQPETPDVANLRFTLNTAATRLQVLQSIAKQTGRKLNFRPSQRSVLTKRVPIECKQTSLQELVILVLKDTGLTGNVTATAIEVVND